MPVLLSNLLGGFSGVGFNGCHLIQTADQTIADSTTDFLDFDTAVYDTNGYTVFGGSPNNLVTIPDTGYYHIQGFVRWDGNATGFRSLFLYINGTVYNRDSFDSGGTTTIGHNVAATLFLSAGDTVSIGVFQTSGGNLNTRSGIGTEGDYARLMIHKLEQAVTIATGTWTPTLFLDSVDFDSVTYDTGITSGTYRKIGDVVYLIGNIRTDAITVGSGSGGLKIGGLPFTANEFFTISIGYSASWTNAPIHALVRDGEAVISLYDKTTTQNDSLAMSSGDVATGANSNFIRFSGFYLTDA